MINRLKTAPTEEPVTAAEIRMQARMDLDETAENDLIDDDISAAREMLEHRLGRAIMPQTREVILSEFPANCRIRLDFPNIIAIVSVKYIDADTANETTLPSNKYTLSNWKQNSAGELVVARDSLFPATLQIDNAVVVEYTCGYADAASVPKSIKKWIKMACATWISHREAVLESSRGDVKQLPNDFFNSLVDRYKVWHL